MHDNDKIPLGLKVKDRLTGFSGVLTGRSEFLYGNETLLVQSEQLVDEKPGPSVWFDAGRIKRADVAVPETAEQTRKEAE